MKSQSNLVIYGTHYTTDKSDFSTLLPTSLLVSSPQRTSITISELWLGWLHTQITYCIGEQQSHQMDWSCPDKKRHSLCQYLSQPWPLCPDINVVAALTELKLKLW